MAEHLFATILIGTFNYHTFVKSYLNVLIFIFFNSHIAFQFHKSVN